MTWDWIDLEARTLTVGGAGSKSKRSDTIPISPPLLEVLRALRSSERCHTLPVVVLTSSREERDIVESYDLGVNSYIVKPIEFEKFVEVVHTLGYYWLLLNEPPLAGGDGAL